MRTREQLIADLREESEYLIREMVDEYERDRGKPVTGSLLIVPELEEVAA